MGGFDMHTGVLTNTGLNWGIKNTFLHFTDMDNELCDSRNRRSKSVPVLKGSSASMEAVSISVQRASSSPATMQTTTSMPVPSFGEKRKAKFFDQVGISPKAVPSCGTKGFSVPCNNPGGKDDNVILATKELSKTYEAIAETNDQIVDVNDDVKTVMMKNIPCGCSRKEVVDAIEEAGFKDQYDFFYLPTRRCKSNVGYAFIGFPNAAVAEAFAEAMTGYRFESRKSPKVVSIVPARIQGLTETVEHFKGSRVMNSKWSPIFPDKDTGKYAGNMLQAIAA